MYVSNLALNIFQVKWENMQPSTQISFKPIYKQIYWVGPKNC